MNLQRLTVPQRISASAMLVTILAAFLPWVSIFGVSVRGTGGDGVITLIVALAGLVVLAITSGVFGEARTPGRGSQITLLVLAIIVALVGFYDMNGAAAIGLYLTLLAGIAWVVGAVWQLTLTKAATAASVETPSAEATPEAP
jgi:hypothetical protein